MNELDIVSANENTESIDSTISMPDGEQVTYSLQTVETVSPEDVEVSTWGFIGFSAAGALLILSIGVATVLRMIRGSM